ncbi:hypothetical protein CCACVL1_17599, partial [Corchorus capsularis]
MGESKLSQQEYFNAKSRIQILVTTWLIGILLKTQKSKPMQLSNPLFLLKHQGRQENK